MMGISREITLSQPYKYNAHFSFMGGGGIMMLGVYFTGYYHNAT